MVLSIMHKNRVKKIYCDVNLSVTSLYDDLLYNETVYAYELTPDSEEGDQNCLAIIYNANGISGDLFGIPWLVRLHSYQVSNYDCLKAAVMFISCRTFEWPKDEGVVKPFVVRDYASPLELPIMKYDFFELDSEISEIFRIVSTDYTGRESRFVVDRKCVPDYRKLVSLRVEWQPYFTRYIDRRHNFRYHESYRMYIEPRKKIHLKHCLNLFASEEDLDENHWYCPQCKKHRPAKKQLSLWTLPRVLLVHFKRFSHDRMHKIRETVFYPTKNFQLDNWLANRKIPERIYDLVGVCKHEGNLAAGHYITHRWFEFDDKNVKRISEDDIVSTNAYLLIYLAREEESLRDY
uniref:ubiquitinyl hydrolase 1 n=1 Tax=Romanomermis culicivorax TaxID=13658 RepID=A0A915HH71_ROMCU